MSAQLLRKGKTEFSAAQRALVELSRFRCFLLGLPQDLLGETPQEIVDLLIARHVSLREAYDDETCGALVRGTMAANLFDRSTLKGRMHAWLENGFSRFILIKSFLNGDTERAASIGITLGPAEEGGCRGWRAPPWPRPRRSTGSACVCRSCPRGSIAGSTPRSPDSSTRMAMRTS